VQLALLVLPEPLALSAVQQQVLQLERQQQELVVVR